MQNGASRQLWKPHLLSNLPFKLDFDLKILLQRNLKPPLSKAIWSNWCTDPLLGHPASYPSAFDWIPLETEAHFFQEQPSLRLWLSECSCLNLTNFFFSLVLVVAAAKSLQSCPTLCDPIDGSPPGSLVPGILQARTLEWLAIPYPMHESEKWKWSRSVVSNS